MDGRKGEGRWDAVRRERELDGMEMGCWRGGVKVGEAIRGSRRGGGELVL